MLLLMKSNNEPSPIIKVRRLRLQHSKDRGRVFPLMIVRKINVRSVLTTENWATSNELVMTLLGGRQGQVRRMNDHDADHSPGIPGTGLKRRLLSPRISPY
ncbi:unnamed protein product [Linum trigynum]|uniref:Uncharacterized protein n=1 Tax=Linum trigynum TaxID=586398 RepID=A0AAV2EQ70_9ROSI